MATGYCLKWKYHPNNLLHMFNQLLLNESFTDVIVACEGKAIKCHKMVLSACSKYFEQVFTDYPQQSSTLVILKDMKFSDVQAIIEFMYQGEINVAQDQLSSLLKAAESLQVKGLADISGSSGGGKDSNSSGMGVSKTGLKNENNVGGGGDGDYIGAGRGLASGDDSTPPSPPSICMEGNSDGGSGSQDGHKVRKRGRPPMNDGILNTSGGGVPLLGGGSGGGANETGSGGGAGEDFSLGNLLESHFALQARNRKRVRGKADEEEEEEDEGGENEEEITEEDMHNIVKMNDYIEKGGSRPQFWEEPTTKKIMGAIRSKKMEMKAAAEILGVSYSTLYSRYRELHGYLKMPHTQDTNFNYYQVLNLLRAGQITLPDAAKRLNIHEKTLGSYLTTSITPKKPRIAPSSTSTMSPDPQNYALSMLGNVNYGANQISSVLESSKGEDYSEDESDLEDNPPMGKLSHSGHPLDDNNEGGGGGGGGNERGGGGWE